MSSKVTEAQLRARIAVDPDAPAADLLPPRSFARYAYENKPYPVVRTRHSADDARASECTEWGLTPEEWAEEMSAARLAMAHGMKLDLIQEGFF